MQNNSGSGQVSPRGGLSTGLPRETTVSPRGGPSTRLPRETMTTKKPVRLSAPVFVPATKDALLLRNMQEEENKMGEITDWKYKLVERSGVLLRELLTKSNPWDTSPCGRKKC